MLIIEQLKTESFSAAEESVARYLIDHPSQVNHLTVKALAEATYTHANTVMRLTKKLGYSGWREFQAAYQSEYQYLSSHFTRIDANIPYEVADSPTMIAHKLAQLKQDTLSDTVALLDSSQLTTIQQLMADSDKIILFGSLGHSVIVQDFILKMRRLGKNVYLADMHDYDYYDAYHSDQRTLGIIISYTGENNQTIQCAQILKEQQAKTLSLTQFAENSIASICDYNLYITTRERITAKIGNFSTNTSIIYLLDLLYSLYFMNDYDTHLNVSKTRSIRRDFFRDMSGSPVAPEE